MPKTHTYAFSTPILFFIFNRPEYTQQVFERIRQARPRQLFVVADGPRVPSDIPLIKRTRSLIAVDWECELKTLYADKNMGLKERISSGISWFFDHVERGIILEDDCLPHPSFFQFCEEMLEYYSNHNHIMMITGSNPLQDHVMDTSYTFSEYFSIWGWATWRRAWKQYDKHMTRWPEIKKTKIFGNYIYKSGYFALRAIFLSGYIFGQDKYMGYTMVSDLFN